MTDLTDFLFARIAEDEATARAATPNPWVPNSQGWEDDIGNNFIMAPYHELDISDEDAEHITRWQPARVLAECEAKRQIVQTYEQIWQRALAGAGSDTARLMGAGLDMVLPLLALPYADHPDYDEAWRP